MASDDKSTWPSAQWASHISALTPRIHAAVRKETYPVPPLAGTIDHTLLALDATPQQIRTLCTQANEQHFASVCVRLPHAQLARTLLSPPVRLAVVIAFHTGQAPTAARIAEAQSAIAAGADELDVVLSRAALQEGDYAGVYADLVAVREATKRTTLKLILETSRLSPEEILAASVLAGEAGWEFIKTSTGFDGPGAQEGDVRVMRAVCEVLGRGMKVKASGGIRTAEAARKMCEAGAERLGTSGGVGIVQGQGGGEGY